MVIGKPASDAGIEDDLEDFRSALVAIDEAGHMFAAVNGAHAPSYLTNAMAVLLRLYSDSAGTFLKRRLGNGGKPRPPDAKTTVLHPCVSALFFTTPEKFSQSVRTHNVEEGLLGRTLFHVDETYVDLRRARPFKMPPGVLPRPHVVPVFRPIAGHGEVAVAMKMGEIVIAESAEAARALDACLADINARARRGASDSLADMLLARTYEKVRRVAGVLAYWENPANPVILQSHVDWAREAIEASNAELLNFASTRLNDSAVLADAQKVLNICQKIKSKQLVASDPNDAYWVNQGKVPARLALARSRLDVGKFNTAVLHLCEVGDLVEHRESRTASGPSTRVLLLP